MSPRGSLKKHEPVERIFERQYGPSKKPFSLAAKFLAYAAATITGNISALLTQRRIAMRKLVHVIVLMLVAAAGGCAQNVRFVTLPVGDHEPYETGFLGPMSAKTRIDIGSITITNTSKPPAPLEVVVHEIVLALPEKSPRKDITPAVVGKPGEPPPKKSDCNGPQAYALYTGEVARVRVPPGEDGTLGLSHATAAARHHISGERTIVVLERRHTGVSDVVVNAASEESADGQRGHRGDYCLSSPLSFKHITWFEAKRCPVPKGWSRWN